MSLPSPYAQYQRTNIETASPTRLVVILYDGAIRFLSQALPPMQAKDYEQQTRLIGKAQAILAHLQGTLNQEAGGPAAQHLGHLYATLYDALTDANIHDKPARVQEVIDALRELRDAWIEVDRQIQAGKSSSGDVQSREMASV